MWKSSNWLLAVSALGLAFLAQGIVEAARIQGLSVPPVASWLLFGLAAILLVIAAGPTPRLVPAGVAPLLSRVREMRHRTLFVGCLTSACVCAAASAPLFWMLNAADPQTVAASWAVNDGSWLLYLVSLLLFALAFVVWERNTPAPVEGNEADPPADRLPRRREWALIAGLFVFALLLRVVNLEQAPPGLWFDEAQNGIVARQLVAPGGAHLTFISGYTQMGALFFYFVGLAVRLFGNLAWPVRLLPALAGAALAPLIYLIGARLYGQRTGLAAAGLLSVSAWNITFSRYGVDTVPTVALDVAIYLCVFQALRTGRLGYFAGAGVLLGLVLQMYYIGMLVPMVLLVMLVHMFITERRHLLPALRAGAGFFLLGALLSFLPVALFAGEKPDIFNTRIGTVSIFRPDIQAAQPDILQTNIAKHLLMFNWVGDDNPKQNLPLAPMLDWVTAALFLAGIGSCLLRARQKQYFFPVIWLLFSMVGGVFSKDAPHSQRTIENSVVTVLVAGIFLGDVLKIVSSALARLRIRARSMADPRRSAQFAGLVSAIGIFVVVAGAGSMTLYRYFVLQVNDRTVAWEMNSPLAEIGHYLAHYSATRDIYVDLPYYYKEVGRYPAAVAYLAPGAQVVEWKHTIPLNGNRDATVLLHPVSEREVPTLTRLYPHATVDLLLVPHDPRPMLYTVSIPAADIEAAQGVHAAVYAPGAAQPREELKIPGLEFDWSREIAGPGTVYLTATLRVDEWAGYTYEWQPAGGTADSSGFLLDGYSRPPGIPIWLATGLHSIIVTDTVKTAIGISQLVRTPADTSHGGRSEAIPTANLFDPRRVEPSGLTVLFRNGISFGVPVAAQRIDTQVDDCFTADAPPLPLPYTAEWIGQLYIPMTGTYGFAGKQTGKFRLYLDGELVIRNVVSGRLGEAQLRLAAGWHQIRLLMQDSDKPAASYMHLYWTPPGYTRSIIPSAFLWPFANLLPETTWRPTLDQAAGLSEQECGP
ncbi:MAG: glycosyltransferase family 39 protein [Chloroflexia bacterium]